MISRNLRKEGQDAEALAADYLKQQNYRILERNYRINGGEIDIIAREGSTICFVEVKMRRTMAFGTPFEAVPKIKMQKIIQVALYYLHSQKIGNAKARFDVVAVTPQQSSFKMDLLKNAFRLDEASPY